MLVELRIRDFAIIEQVELELGPGLVVFTGETGAGKSILVDAVEMLLGARAESVFIRQGKDRALVEGTFRLPPPVQDQVRALLDPEGLLDDPEYLTLAREIRANGRHIARINGRTVTLHLLRQVGELLVDVHGQSEHLSLFRVQEHLALLDRFAAVEPLLQGYGEVYNQLQRVRRTLAELRRSDREAAQRADLLRFQIQEIEAAALIPGEEEALQEERTRLANAEKLAALAQTALTLLDEGTTEVPPVSDLLGQAVEALRQLAHIDATQGELAETLTMALEQTGEVVRRLRHYAEELEFDPRRLDEVEERLALIENLKRKYGASIEEVLAYAERAREELDNITHAEERIAALEEEEERLLAQLAERGMALSQARREAAVRLARSVEAELRDLRMAQARFEVAFTQRPDPAGVPLPDGTRVAFDAQGLDAVEFLLAPNPGEGLKPLAKIASGGESARLMLALKRVLASADPRPTLIFDEVDQGIGGRIGAVVGEKLWRLARHHQVLCVTHLPQLAAFGDQHWRVQKQVVSGRTVTRIEPLRGEARIVELAQMLGEVTEATLQSAHDLLQRAHQVTRAAA